MRQAEHAETASSDRCSDTRKQVVQLGRIARACTWASRGQLRSQESSVHRSIDFLMGRRNFTLREYAIVRSKRQRRRDDVRSVVPRHDVRCGARRWNADRVRAIRKRYPFFKISIKFTEKQKGSQCQCISAEC